MEKPSLENPDDPAHSASTAAMMEEKKVKSSDEEEDALLAEINKEGDRMNHTVHVKQQDNSRKRPSSTATNDLTSIGHEDQLRSTKAKIVEVREENEKLKQLLSKTVKDYQSLQKHFSKAVQEEEAEKATKPMPANCQEDQEEPELVILSLGRSSSNEPRDQEEKKSSNLSDDDEELNKKGLSLSLDCKFEPDSSVAMKNLSSENSFDGEPKEDEPTETWPPKTTASADDEVLQQNQIKRTRVSVRTRCDTPTMNDGCQWRKYGQKIAKGNPCPRAYYRCTGSPACPVRKQVQRCAQDMSILITTYEGSHNHPLPISATAMASTTSAAVSMLQSRSSTSSHTSSTSAPASISNGLNFTLSQNSPKPQQQFYFPNSSISTSGSHPTIIIDLTNSPSTTHTSPYFNRFSSVSRCLNFSSSSLSSTTLDHSFNTLQSLWNSTSLNRNYVEKKVTQDHHHHFYQPYMQAINSQPSLTDSIVAATKVIASNPTFRSALAASITSIVSKTGGSSTTINPGVEDHHSGLSLKLGGQHQHHQSLAFHTLHPSSNNNE